MKNRGTRVWLLLLLLIGSVLCGCSSTEKAGTVLQIDAQDFELQNDEGQTLSYDGEHLQGTMIWEFLGNVEGELWFEIPDSSSFSGKSGEERYSVTLENQDTAGGSARQEFRNFN